MIENKDEEKNLANIKDITFFIDECQDLKTIKKITKIYSKKYKESKENKKIFILALKKYKLLYKIQRALSTQNKLKEEDAKKRINSELRKLDKNKNNINDPFLSLDEIYAKKDRKAVSVISPNQIVNHTTNSKNEVHNFMIEKIEQNIYNIKMDKYNFKAQDIQIKYLNVDNENDITYVIYLSCPKIINSGQYMALKNINEMIKNTKKNIFVYSMIKDYISGKDKFELFEEETNLDKTIDKLIISDDYEPPLYEKYIVGYPNYTKKYIKEKRK